MSCRCLFQNRTSGENCHWFLWAECPSCHQQCQSTDGNSKHWPQPRTTISCRWQTRAMRCITANVLQTSDNVTTLLVESCQFAATAPAFNLPNVHLAPPLGVTPFEFWWDYRHQKTTVHGVPGLLCGVVCVILRLAVSVEHWIVTDRCTDRQTDTWQQLIPALASIAQVKIKRRTYLQVQENHHSTGRIKSNFVNK